MTSQRPRTPAELYETFFVPAMFHPWSQVLLEHAAPQPGERLLDVACGTGIVARNAAPRLGETGSVVAVDLRPGMLAVARATRPPAGAPIEWREGDAVTLDVPDGAFDLVTCQHGLQFFSDRVAALSRMRRALAPRGRLAVSVWQSLDRQGVFHSLLETETKHLAPLGATEADAVLPFSLGDADELRELLSQAGFTDVTITPCGHDVVFPDADNFIRNVEGAYAAVMPAFAEDPALFDQFVENVTRDAAGVLAEHRDGDHLRFRMNANVAVARG